MTGTLALAPAGDDDLVPGSFAGDYEIEVKIGEGGMGSVYGARHTLIGKRAAIKVIRADLSASQAAVDRFVLEAQSVNQIGHPNIVDVFGFGRLPDGRSFFVMEWLRGETLKERLGRPLSFVDAIDIVDTIAKALQAAHEAGVLHRDLKPDNVYLATVKDERPTIKLLDFGLAKLSSRADNRIDRTRTGVVMGTPLYISPEQAKGVRVDTPTDVYSLGSMAFEMFCGHVPFSADSGVEIMSMHITAPPPLLRKHAPQLPVELETLILSMMAKDPARRPTAAQVRKSLAALRASATGTVGEPRVRSSFEAMTPTPVPGVPPTKHRVGVYAMVAIGAVAVGAGVLWLLSHRETRVTTRGSDTAPVVVMSMPMPVAPPSVAVAPVDPKPADPKPADPKPADPKPADPKPADPKPAEAPRLGTVVVKLVGVPRGQILVDGKIVGARVAELQLQLTPGDHEIGVRSPNHQPAATRVHVVVGTRQEVRLTPEPNANAVHDPFGSDW